MRERIDSSIYIFPLYKPVSVGRSETLIEKVCCNLVAKLESPYLYNIQTVMKSSKIKNISFFKYDAQKH